MVYGGEGEINCVRHQQNASLFFFENEVPFCTIQQNLFTTFSWQMNSLQANGPFTLTFKTFPLAKVGISNLNKVELSHYLHRYPAEGVSATINYSVNGTHIYTDSLATGQLNKSVKIVSTDACLFEK